jgi:trk system potassium uptake protein TrkH
MLPPRMQAMQRVFGAIVALSSLVAVPPLVLAWLWKEPTEVAFLESLVAIAGVGLALWYPVRRAEYELRLRDGFLITAALWAIASLVTALPFMLAAPHLRFVDAVFESTSGLTTTGATVISGLDELPRSMLFYRQSLQFVGGMGIVILAVAIMPMLKVGGMQLFRAETTGPTRDHKLTPRIAETARALWFVYLGLNALCAAAYWIGGMSLFDAVCHAMSTVASGGFSTHDANFGYWDSPLLEAIACVLMLVAATNFGMHWYAWRRATLQHYQADSELRGLLLVAAFVTLR